LLIPVIIHANVNVFQQTGTAYIKNLVLGGMVDKRISFSG
jgi:hypothetical protein